MVETPTLTASASSSAIKASDRPDSCWRLSPLPLTKRQHEFEKHRQDQRRAQHQRREHGKSRNQGIAEPQESPGGSKRRQRQRALVCEPSSLRLLPRVRLGGGEQRHPERL